MNTNKPILIFIVGPTATGKSDFAVAAAEKFGGEIINSDSVQVYRGVDIGTAKPTLDQMKNIPHHLFDFVPEGATYTAGEFRRDALRVIGERFQNQTAQIFHVVGGSGFYVQALEKGMFEVPKVPPQIRDEVDRDLGKKGLNVLYDELVNRDPEYAATLSPNDRYRIVRAVELLRFQPKTVSEIRKEFAEKSCEQDFHAIKIGLYMERALLRDYVRKRTRVMLERGLVEEVRSLRDRELESWAPMLSVGYRETQEYLNNELSFEALEEKIVISTMQLAKRQMTWFRRDPAVKWFKSDLGWNAPLAYLQDELSRIFGN